MSDAESRLVAILKSADIPRAIEWYGAAGFEIRGYVPESDPTFTQR